MGAGRYVAAFVLVVVGCAAAPVRNGDDGGRAAPSAVGCIGMTVSDADRMAAFYEDVLMFRRNGAEMLEGAAYPGADGKGTATRRARLELGDECLELDQPLGVALRPVPPDSQSNDRWFQHVAIVVSDMDRAYQRLEAHGVTHASSSPQTLPAWNEKAAGISAYYFKDPDAHSLEIIHFPAGKADARWQRHDRLFLGIDHTAIVVDDTRASVAFYANLGLRIAGGSENYGPEQEALNHVAGAHLRITALRASAGPGIELLEYLFPRTGRPFPPDAGTLDLIYWRTTVLATGAPSTAATLRDPDGHTMELHRL